MPPRSKAGTRDSLARYRSKQDFSRTPEPSVLTGRTNGPSANELAELDALKTSGTWTVFGRELRVTNLDKVLFPARAGEDPVTKPGPR